MSTPDMILHNATIHTMNGERSKVSAMAIGDGRIIAVGGDDTVLEMAGSETEVRDLQGAVVIPGLVDVHNHHLLAGEVELFRLSFPPTASFDEVLEYIREFSKGLGPDEWVIGESFGSLLIDKFSTAEARRQVDEAAGGRPVALTDDSHHNKFANTRALELAGITPESVAPPGGEIVRDPETGELTGLLYEGATLALNDAIDRFNPHDLDYFAQCSAKGIEILSSLGITAFQDAAASLDVLKALHALDSRSELNAWVVSCLLSAKFVFANSPVGDELIAQREDYRSTHHKPDFIKVALDGVPTTETGAFLKPYRQRENHACHCGATTMAPEDMKDWILHTAEFGLGAKVHCTGDAAVRVALDAFEAAREAGYQDVKFQIAHGQFIDEQDMSRFVDLDVDADVSPFLWFPGVIPDAIKMVRPEEDAPRIQPNRTLIDLGVNVAGGSDWPVSVSPNPWEGIQGLVTRADPLNRAPGTLVPEQAITRMEAIEAFTINGARAMGLEDEVGSLEAGKSADFVILSQDPFEVEVTKLIETEAVETWFAGRQVFSRAGTGDS